MSRDNLHLHHLLDYFAANPIWPLLPETAEVMLEVLMRHAAGDRVEAEVLETIAADRSAAAKATDDWRYDVVEGRAIIPVSGIIAKYSAMVNGTSQPTGTSAERIGRQLRDALEDDRVHTIFLHIESPGGSISGISDLAHEIRAAGERKPVIAFADDQATSAAYWLGSQAERFYGSDAAAAGGIGVYTVLADTSRRAEAAGIRLHLVRSGDQKGVGEPGLPIDSADLAKIQRRVDAYVGVFREAVARGRGPRGMTGEQLDAVADGRVLIGREAVAAGLLDGVMTFRQALRSARPAVRPPRRGAGPSATNHPLDQKGQTMSPKTQAETIQVGKPTDPPPAPAETNGPFGKAAEADPVASATWPADLQAVRTEAAGAERERISAIAAALPGEAFATVRETAIAGDLSVEAAQAMALPVAMAALARSETELTALKAAVGRAGVETVGFDAADEEPPPPAGQDGADDDGKAASFAARRDKLQADGLTPGAAITTAADELPASYAAWVRDQQGKR